MLKILLLNTFVKIKLFVEYIFVIIFSEFLDK